MDENPTYRQLFLSDDLRCRGTVHCAHLLIWRLGTGMRALAILGLCIGAAFVCACVFLCMLWFTLPPDDAAFDGPPFAALIDPFFLSGAIVMAVLIGVISFPFVYFIVRRLRLRTTAAFIVGIVLAEIVILTPFDRRLGLVGSLPALVLALCVVRFSGWRLFHPTPSP